MREQKEKESMEKKQFFREKCKEKNVEGIIMPNGEEKLD